MIGHTIAVILKDASRAPWIECAVEKLHWTFAPPYFSAVKTVGQVAKGRQPLEHHRPVLHTARSLP